MKLQCDVEVLSRLLPTYGMKSRGKGSRAVVSIGKHPDKSSQRSMVYMMICTAKDRTGSKYKVRVKRFLDVCVVKLLFGLVIFGTVLCVLFYFTSGCHVFIPG